MLPFLRFERAKRRKRKATRRKKKAKTTQNSRQHPAVHTHLTTTNKFTKPTPNSTQTLETGKSAASSASGKAAKGKDKDDKSVRMSILSMNEVCCLFCCCLFFVRLFLLNYSTLCVLFVVGEIGKIELDRRRSPRRFAIGANSSHFFSFVGCVQRGLCLLCVFGCCALWCVVCVCLFVPYKRLVLLLCCPSVCLRSKRVVVRCLFGVCVAGSTNHLRRRCSQSTRTTRGWQTTTATTNSTKNQQTHNNRKWQKLFKICLTTWKFFTRLRCRCRFLNRRHENKNKETKMLRCVSICLFVGLCCWLCSSLLCKQNRTPKTTGEQEHKQNSQIESWQSKRRRNGRGTGGTNRFVCLS